MGSESIDDGNSLPPRFILPGMTVKPKIGVLTFHRCFNYGSYWQARCLVEGLRELGHEAELLDHDCGRISDAERRCLLQPSLPERTLRSDLPHYKAKGRKFIEATGKLPRSGRFSLHRPEAMNHYDAIVVGSDEVWNFRHPWYGGCPIFFGDGLRAGRLISYGASFGNHDAVDGIHPDWAAKLRKFASLSVRDANSSALVERALNVEPELVLDPCLLFPAVVDAPPGTASDDYALVYGHGFPDWLTGALMRWSRDRGIRLISVGYRNPWCDEQHISAGPLEFAGLMAGSRAVITNFFHGCVFALLNGKPLVGAPSPYRFNKVRDLAAAVGMQRRLVRAETSDEELCELLETAVEQSVADRIADLRRRSGAFVDASLG